MGLFRRRDERAIPEPGSREFEEAVKGTALPSEGSVTMGGAGLEQPGTEAESSARSSDELAEPREPPEDTVERRRRQRVLGALGRTVLRPPNAGGFGAGIPTKRKRAPDG